MIKSASDRIRKKSLILKHKIHIIVWMKKKMAEERNEEESNENHWLIMFSRNGTRFKKPKIKRWAVNINANIRKCNNKKKTNGLIGHEFREWSCDDDK